MSSAKSPPETLLKPFPLEVLTPPPSLSVLLIQLLQALLCPQPFGGGLEHYFGGSLTPFTSVTES